jgi:hypothetical protein
VTTNGLLACEIWNREQVRTCKHAYTLYMKYYSSTESTITITIFHRQNLYVTSSSKINKRKKKQYDSGGDTATDINNNNNNNNTNTTNNNNWLKKKGGGE